MNVPDTPSETDLDVSAKVMAPQRPMSATMLSPRQALWHSGRVKSDSVENIAGTVTTERLGIISRSPQIPFQLHVEYPQRSRNDSVFDATTTDVTSPRLASTLVSFDNTSPRALSQRRKSQESNFAAHHTKATSDLF